ncbi:MAG: hypothetical protein I3I97_08405 [Bifidobacterium thermophilum]|nr:hypothetical protein [Bifidobacterium thermophilum]
MITILVSDSNATHAPLRRVVFLTGLRKTSHQAAKTMVPATLALAPTSGASIREPCHGPIMPEAGSAMTTGSTR